MKSILIASLLLIVVGCRQKPYATISADERFIEIFYKDGHRQGIDIVGFDSLLRFELPSLRQQLYDCKNPMVFNDDSTEYIFWNGLEWHRKSDSIIALNFGNNKFSTNAVLCIGCSIEDNPKRGDMMEKNGKSWYMYDGKKWKQLIMSDE